MRIYNIADILPLYKSYTGVVVLPNQGLFESDEERGADEVESFIDNDDIDFVMRNIEHGQIAEDFVKNLLLKLYRNCEKVKAREGYDFKVIINNKEIRIEVKSIHSYNAPFHITINEIDNAIKYEKNYYLCFAVLPYVEKGVTDIKFLRDPVDSLGITVPFRKYDGLKQKCTIMSEKFLIKPREGLVKSLSGLLDYD